MGIGVKARLIVDEVEVELAKAMESYGPMHSHHDGYAIIKEELDELWEEIRVKPKYRSVTTLRREAIQVAAMAVRFILDTLPDEDL